MASTGEKKAMTSKVPVSALRMTVTDDDFLMGDNGEGARSAPLKLTARTGEVIDHFCFGRTIHDMSGMTHKGRIPVDYLHDPAEVIGYINKFEVVDGNLHLSGALTPYGDKDRASEIIAKARQGVPYEASIYWPPSRPGDVEIEKVDEGEMATVNGQSFAGPLTIFRKWPLRGVAVCPYGADSGTSAQVEAASDCREVVVMETKNATSKETTVEQKDMTKAVEGATQESASATPAPASEATVKAEKEVEKAAEATTAASDSNKSSETRSEFKQFVEAFGPECAATYYADGLSMADAQAAYVKDLRAERDALKAKVSELEKSGDASKAVAFDSSDGTPPLPNGVTYEGVLRVIKRGGGTEAQAKAVYDSMIAAAQKKSVQK